MLHAGVLINYARSVESSRTTFSSGARRGDLGAALFEKDLLAVVDAVASGSPTRRRIFNWARDVGNRGPTSAGRPPVRRSWPCSTPWRRLVFAKLRERVGGRIRYFVSGGAPLNPDVARSSTPPA